MRVLAAVAGVLLLVVTGWSVLRTLVVPRGASRLVEAKNALQFALFRAVARLGRTYIFRDRVLIWSAPVAIISSLIMWLLMFWVAYGLLFYATGELDLAGSLREAGSSLFTLGFASTSKGDTTVLDFAAALTGPIVTALLIGYLPTLYSTYQRREAEVTLMQARAGEPNWGPELLARHAQVGTVGQLPELWPRWEQWAAEVSESHTNFPILIQMRSTRPERNWLIALLCAMDATAMEMSLNPGSEFSSARLMMRQGIVCLREMAKVESISFDEDPSPTTPSQVSLAEFRSACEDLRSLGYPMERGIDEAYAHFVGWRANYEPIAYELAARIDAVPAPWSGSRRPPLPVIAPVRPINRTPETG